MNADGSSFASAPYAVMRLSRCSPSTIGTPASLVALSASMNASSATVSVPISNATAPIRSDWVAGIQSASHSAVVGAAVRSSMKSRTWCMCVAAISVKSWRASSNTAESVGRDDCTPPSSPTPSQSLGSSP